ncbi:MAG TPA: Tellurium resistance protein TerA [Patescibacteria group bacterium]|nr:Tellurium resistance protein TerA [Patescibacteria group bacterium]
MADDIPRNKLSSDSLEEASRDRSKFSGHGDAIGAAGTSTEGEIRSAELARTGDFKIVNPLPGGFGEIRVGAAWDNVSAETKGFFAHLLHKFTERKVDLDLGCLYELKNGERGAIQAFGDMFGDYNRAPWIKLSEDARKGRRLEDGEFILINGGKWPEIKRMLIYVYIYGESVAWDQVRPRIGITIPGEEQITAFPGLHDSTLSVAAIAGLENSNNGIKVINYTEYFPGHAEMDRAFGYGIQWTEGSKQEKRV